MELKGDEIWNDAQVVTRNARESDGVANVTGFMLKALCNVGNQLERIANAMDEANAESEIQTSVEIYKGAKPNERK